MQTLDECILQVLSGSSSVRDAAEKDLTEGSALLNAPEITPFCIL